MKSILEFTHQRNDDLMRAFKFHIKNASHIFLPDIFSLVAESPAERFWVSEERAAVVISALIAGRPLPKMRPNKKEMFHEILNRFLVLKQQRPNQSISSIVSEIVHQPAPKFYLTPRTVGEIIFRIKAGFYD